MPGHFYELFPIAVLIGTIYSLARLAQASEFTILRTGGLGPGARTAPAGGDAGLLGFGALTFVVGDYVAPVSRAGRMASCSRPAFKAAAASVGGAGAWLKERRKSLTDGERSAVDQHRRHRPASAAVAGCLHPIFEFDANGRPPAHAHLVRARPRSAADVAPGRCHRRVRSRTWPAAWPRDDRPRGATSRHCHDKLQLASSAQRRRGGRRRAAAEDVDVHRRSCGATACT